jgi:hypothetical protein
LGRVDGCCRRWRCRKRIAEPRHWACGDVSSNRPLIADQQPEEKARVRGDRRLGQNSRKTELVVGICARAAPPFPPRKSWSFGFASIEGITMAWIEIIRRQYLKGRTGRIIGDALRKIVDN